MNTKIEQLLNEQVKNEAKASYQYLAMSSWAEENGYSGIAEFFMNQSDEERMHQIKLIKFINERGSKVVFPKLDEPKTEFSSVYELFDDFLKSEMFVTEKINHIIFECLQHKDYTVHNFMQWYVTEQLEEEAVARNVLDKLKIISDDKTGIYMFDRDILSFTTVDNTNQ